MDFELINPLTCRGWDDLVLTADNYSFFHSAAWARVLCESYGYRPSFFALSERGGASLVIPLLEIDSVFTGRRGVSLPFSDYCEPLGFGGARLSEVPAALIETAKKAGWNHLDFRGGDFPPGLPLLSQYLCHRLRLCGEKELLSGLHKNTLRNLKKAEASGVTTTVFNSLEGMREYYRLHCLTRKRQGAPPQPFSFFKKVHEHVCSKGGGRVVLALHRGRAVAGGVFFHFGRTAMYKYGASDRSSSLGANAAVMWEAIRLYAGEGCASFCFGRTDPENHGLRRFKLGFGPEEYRLQYRRYDVLKNAFVEGKSRSSHPFKRFFSRIPLSALKAVGLAYKHFG